MPQVARRRRSAGNGLLIAVLVLAVLATVPIPIRTRMRDWTGEEDLLQQIKGSLALAWLRVTRAEPSTAPYVPLEHAGLSPYGVNTFLEQEADPGKVERSMALIAEAGFHWIRQEFPWEDIEISGKGDFWDHKWDQDAWAKYDRIVDAAERYGLEIVARLDNPPAWSRAVGNAPGWEKGPPDDYTDYGDFVYAVVSRYRGRIRYYQIWNEPNIYPEWGEAADPHAMVISAGLSTTGSWTDEARPDDWYLQSMYEAMGGNSDGCFDVLGAHGAGYKSPPEIDPDEVAADEDLGGHRAFAFRRVEDLRAIMVQYGDADKQIALLEFGWTSDPRPESPYNWHAVSEETKADYLVRAYQYAKQNWSPWIGLMSLI